MRRSRTNRRAETRDVSAERTPDTAASLNRSTGHHARSNTSSPPSPSSTRRKPVACAARSRATRLGWNAGPARRGSSGRGISSKDKNGPVAAWTSRWRTPRIGITLEPAATEAGAPRALQSRMRRPRSGVPARAQTQQQASPPHHSTQRRCDRLPRLRAPLDPAELRAVAQPRRDHAAKEIRRRADHGRLSRNPWPKCEGALPRACGGYLGTPSPMTFEIRDR